MAASPSQQDTATTTRPVMKSFGLLLGVVATAMLGWYAVESGGRVDSSEFDLLDTYVEPALDTDQIAVLEKSRSDPSPCWLWCEDYLLAVRATWLLELQNATDGAAVCQALTGILSSHIGRPPDQATEYPAQACVITWTDVQWADRQITVRAQARHGPTSTATLVVTNASTQRGSPL